MARLIVVFLKVSFMFFVGKGLVCIFVCFCVSLDHLGFALLVSFVAFWCFQ